MLKPLVSACRSSAALCDILGFKVPVEPLQLALGPCSVPEISLIGDFHRSVNIQASVIQCNFVQGSSKLGDCHMVEVSATLLSRSVEFP